MKFLRFLYLVLITPPALGVSALALIMVCTLLLPIMYFTDLWGKACSKKEQEF